MTRLTSWSIPDFSGRTSLAGPDLTTMIYTRMNNINQKRAIQTNCSYLRTWTNQISGTTTQSNNWQKISTFLAYWWKEKNTFLCLDCERAVSSCLSTCCNSFALDGKRSSPSKYLSINCQLLANVVVQINAFFSLFFFLTIKDKPLRSNLVSQL